VRRGKFCLALLLATSWFVLCLYLAAPWIAHLAEVVGYPVAYLLVSLIALIPGFMYVFTLVSFLESGNGFPKGLDDYPALSVVVAAYNEQRNIVAMVESIMAQHYPGQLEIIVVDDGSTDGTHQQLIGLSYAQLRTVQTPHSGKAHALNVGLENAQFELIVTVDADTYLHTNALQNIVEELVSGSDYKVAVAGSVYAHNVHRSLMTKVQSWDFLSGIASIKRMQGLFSGTLVAQGAFSIYRKSVLQEIKGWPIVVGEDIVLTWDLLGRNYLIGHCEHAIAFTDLPVSYRKFFQQRCRWSRGLVEAFMKHPSILVRPRLTTFFIYWNLLFPLIDVLYICVFIPGVVAALFGHFLIAGPVTLAVIPISLTINLIVFIKQRALFQRHGLKLQQNRAGFLLYLLGYTVMMAPACMLGYAQELVRVKKSWGTK